jgi:hypothetical protein
MTGRPGGRTDAELGQLDVPALLRAGLAYAGPSRARLFGDGVVAAAIAADRVGVHPRSLAFLAEVVRRGGIRYAAGLPEPLPGPARAALARDWLAAAGTVPTGPGPAVAAAADDTFAGWLDAVSTLVDLRQRHVNGR